MDLRALGVPPERVRFWRLMRFILRVGRLWDACSMLLTEWNGRYWWYLIRFPKARVIFLARWRRKHRANIDDFTRLFIERYGGLAPPLREFRAVLADMYPKRGKHRRRKHAP